MKWILVIGLVLAALVAIIVAIGFMVPTSHVATRTASVPSTCETVIVNPDVALALAVPVAEIDGTQPWVDVPAVQYANGVSDELRATDRVPPAAISTQRVPRESSGTSPWCSLLSPNATTEPSFN